MKFYGELLIYILLFITNARVFFLKRAKRDPLVSLAPVSLLLSILFILAWGLDFFTIAAFVIAILVVLSNFHALFRYTERLYVDHYSPLMIIWSFLTMALSAFAIAAVIFFRPLELDNKTIGVTESKTRLSGTFKGGFVTVNNFKKANANIFTFEKTQDDENTEVPNETPKIILFIPDKRADTYYYKPYLQQLALEGFTVISGDFYTSDCKWIHNIEDSKYSRRFSLMSRSILKNQWFMMQREYYTYNISLELKAMDDFITQTYGDAASYFIICDVMADTACDDFISQNNSKITGYLKLDTIDEYTTKGYGFVTETDPLLYAILNKQYKERKIELPNILNISTSKIAELTGAN